MASTANKPKRRKTAAKPALTADSPIYIADPDGKRQYIAGRRYEPGEKVIGYHGVPGASLIPVNAAAKKAAGKTDIDRDEDAEKEKLKAAQEAAEAEQREEAHRDALRKRAEAEAVKAEEKASKAAKSDAKSF